MAKKKDTGLTDIFKKTTQGESEPQADPITSRGVGLRVSEWAEVDRIAAEWNVTPHSVAVMGVRYFLAELAAGNIETETEKKVTIKTSK